MADKETVDGVVLMDEDGASYFIPSEDLASYRVPDELDGNSEVSGFASSKLKPQIREISALKGPLGLRPVLKGIGPCDPTETIAAYRT